MTTTGKCATPEENSASGSPRRFDFLIVVGFFSLLLSGFFLAYRMGGPTPVLTADTINDEKFIRTCLNDACYFTGMGTSSELLVHGANFLHFKTFLRFIGVSEDALHVFLEFILGLSVLLTAIAGYRIAKSVGASVSALIFAFLICILVTRAQLDFHPAMTYNHRVMPFFGALFLLLATKAVEKKSLVSLMFSAVILGIGTNIHMQFLAGFPALFLFGFLVKGWRGGMLGVLLATFTSFLTSFQAFTKNCANILRGFSSALSDSVRFCGQLTSFQSNKVLVVSLLLLLLYTVVLLFSRNKGARSVVFVPAIIVLFKVIFVGLASCFGTIEIQNKYFLEVLPALGITAGVIAFESLHLLSQRLATFVTSSPIPVLLASVLIPLLPHPHYSKLVEVYGLPHLTSKDMSSLLEYLRGLGWNTQKVITSLRGPSASDIIDFLTIVSQNSQSVEPQPRDTTVLYVFKLRNEDIPKVNSLIVLRRDEYSSLVAIKENSVLSIYDFELCLQEPTQHQCSYKRVGVRDVSTAFPSPSKRLKGLLKVRFDLDLKGEQAGKVIFMPKLKDRCNGRIVKVTGGRSRIAEDGRMAILEADGQEETGSIEFEWKLGSKECSAWSYKGAMPFFLELSRNDAEKVIATFSMIEELIADRE